MLNYSPGNRAKGKLDQAARQGLSAKIRFARANTIFRKCQVFLFFVEWASGSRFFSLFLVLVGAEISVESTFVPFFSSKPRSWSNPATCANSFSCIPLRISRFRNRPSVSLSGTWLLESTPQNSENARLSITSATAPSSDNVYRFCNTYSRSISSIL